MLFDLPVGAVRESAEDLRARFARDGFVHMPGVLDGSQVAALRRCIESTPERSPEPNPLTLGTMRFASNLFYEGVVLQQFLCSEAVTHVVRTLLGDGAWVRWDQAVWKEPGAPEFPIHQDNGYTGLEADHLQLWVALTGMDHDNGGLVVAPGHHRTDFHHRWAGNHVTFDTPVTTTLLPAAAGDIVVFSSRLPHATTPNISTTSRLAYVAEFLGVNLFRGRFEANAPHAARVVALPLGVLVLDAEGLEGAPGNVTTALVHPREITLSRNVPEGTARNVFAGVIEELAPEPPHGELVRVSLAGDLPLIAEVTRGAVEALDLKPGTPVYASFKAAGVTVVP